MLKEKKCVYFNSLSGPEMTGSVFTSGSVDGVSSLNEEGVDMLGLSTDSLSRLRSPSVMEVREKGNERLKEELAKAQRVRFLIVIVHF